jgi:PTS system fructose-specific IIC component/PTS system nitrogen regulatory IIA component
VILDTVFSADLIKVDLESVDKDEVFEELVDVYASANPSCSRDSILTALRDREDKLSTGVKPGIALPHARTEEITGVRGIIGISRKGIDYDSLDGKPVHVIFMILSNKAGCALQLRVLKRLSSLFDNPAFFQDIISSKSSNSLYGTICKFEDTMATTQ